MRRQLRLVLPAAHALSSVSVTAQRQQHLSNSHSESRTPYIESHTRETPTPRLDSERQVKVCQCLLMFASESLELEITRALSRPHSRSFFVFHAFYISRNWRWLGQYTICRSGADAKQQGLRQTQLAKVNVSCLRVSFGRKLNEKYARLY